MFLEHFLSLNCRHGGSLYIRGVTVHVFVLNRFGTGCSVRCGGAPNEFPYGHIKYRTACVEHAAAAHAQLRTP